MSVNAEQKCYECGGLIPAGAAHCPACMLGRAMGGEDSLGDLLGETTSSLDGAPVTEVAGDSIGAYKLLEKIGEGGFGVVYMAKQEAPVRRQVALKIVKLGMDTKQVVGRFEVERQALAMMEHPSIAKVLDAGCTETGRPYFVMELVHGVPITEFCNENRLTTEERLKLFVKVCHAVQHAHQKGVIHRDLKPSNILVTMHDDEAVPKVIDFGIAKATQHDLTDKTLFTQFRHFLGTPAYMSPEQAQMSGLGVDTRSDIYSLGVLLYELLTGATPLDLKPALESGYDAVRQTIREGEPLKPSTRLSQLTQLQQSTLAKQSRSEVRSIQSQLKGDLDWIVMRAIEKDRSRRYGTADLFAQDVEAYLRDDPVSAVAPSPWYLLRKLARRHRPIVASVLVSLPLLTAALIISSWLLVRERAANARSSAMSADLQSQLDYERELTYVHDMGKAHALLNENRVPEAESILDRYHPDSNDGNSREDYRDFAWFYLRDQIQAYEYQGIATGHDGQISGLTYTPDGRLLVSTSWKGEIFVWDAQERRLADRLQFGEERSWGWWGMPAFSSDGKFLIVRERGNTPGELRGKDLECRLWRRNEGRYQPRKSFFYHAFPHGGRMNASRVVRFIPGTHVLAIARRPAGSESREMNVVLYDVEKEKEIGILSNAGTILDVGPSGNRLLTRRWLGERPELVMWDLSSQMPLLEKVVEVGADYVNFLDDDWIIAGDPPDAYVVLSSATLEKGPDWAASGIDAHVVVKAQRAPVYLFRGRTTNLFDERVRGLQTLVTDVGETALALHPDGGICAMAEPTKHGGGQIRFVAVGERRMERQIDVDRTALVFAPDGASVWLNPRGESLSRAHHLPGGEPTRHQSGGIVVGHLEGDEVWYKTGDAPEGTEFAAMRAGSSFSATSFKTETQVSDVRELRTGNLLFLYSSNGAIEVRDRATLKVLAVNEVVGEVYSMSDRCAYSEASDTYGRFSDGRTGGGDPSYEFFRGDTLELIPWQPTPEYGVLVDLDYSSSEEQFLVFYNSGWVEKRSSWNLEVMKCPEFGGQRILLFRYSVL